MNNGYNPYSQNPFGGYPQYPYGYQSQMQRQGQMAMQQAQPPMPTMQQPVQQPVLPTLCYAKMEEAKPYIITNPNSSMLFIDREKGKALLKSTDNVCNSYPRYFNIIETDENGNSLQPKEKEKTAQVDFSQFATLTQFNDLLMQFNDLKNMFSQIKQAQAQIKPTTNDLVQGKGNTQLTK